MTDDAESLHPAPVPAAGEEGRPDSSHSMLAKIAHLYYIENLSQREIGQRTRMSVASVSRALARARELKIVSISIQGGENDFSQLEIEIEGRFGLAECLLVPSYGRMEHTFQGMAAAVADLLSRTLKPGATLGLSWGDTLRAVGESLARMPSVRADVIPIIGALGWIETGIYPNSIARTFAQKLGGSAYLVNTPAFVDDPDTRKALMEDSNFRPVRDLWSRLDMAVLGVSALTVDSSMCRSGIFTEADLDRMREAGGECISNFVVFDGRGRMVPTPVSDRMVYLPLEDLRRVRTVAIAAAGAAKAEPLRAMLRSGICSALVTDTDCARALLSLRSA